ncbi:MAG: nucleoside triphosphate pyrophosphohydrolase family protein [Symbiobacteriia bacterium]
MSDDPKSQLFEQFQNLVGETLIRHRSIVDILSKSQEANARVNRAVAKAVTSCGCVQIGASKQQVPEDTSLYDLKNHMDDHISGTLCEHCLEAVESELGRQVYYLTALCNVLGLDLYEVVLKEQQRVATLGVFHAS